MTDTATADAIRDVLVGLADWLERETQRMDRIEAANIARVEQGNDSRAKDKRDWFAGQAMSGMMTTEWCGGLSYYDVARYAYALADEMLKARDVQ